MSSGEFQSSSAEQDNFGGRLRALGKRMDSLLPKVDLGIPSWEESDDEGGKITIIRTSSNTNGGFRYKVGHTPSLDQDNNAQSVMYSYHPALPENPFFQEKTTVDLITGKEIVEQKFEEEDVQIMEDLINTVEMGQSSG